MSEKKKEENSPSADKIIPSKNDVLCGRGSGVNSSSGNIYFRELVREKKEEYKRAMRNMKIPITKEIISRIKNLDPPGRFLIRGKDNEWKEVNNEHAMVKTAQALREGGTSTDRDRMFLNGNKKGSPKHGHSSPRIQPTTPSSNTQYSDTQSGAHYGVSGFNGLDSSYPVQSSYTSVPYSVSSNTEQSECTNDSFMSNHITHPYMLYENGQQQIQTVHSYASNVLPHIHIPSMGQVRSRFIPVEESGRFDDAEEHIDTSLKALMDLVQMRRREKLNR